MADDALLVAPDFVLPMTEGYSTIVSKFESGVEQRRSRRTNPIRSWKLEFRNRTQTDFEAVQDLFELKAGQLTSFLWTNPLDSVQYTVRFNTDSIEFQEIAYQIYNFSFDLIQVI